MFRDTKLEKVENEISGIEKQELIRQISFLLLTIKKKKCEEKNVQNIRGITNLKTIQVISLSEYKLPTLNIYFLIPS